MSTNVIVPLFPIARGHYLHGHGRLEGTLTRIEPRDLAALHLALVEQVREDIRHGFQLRAAFYRPAAHVGDQVTAAEDIAQESVIALIEHDGDPIPADKILGWLQRDARRRLRNICRRREPNPLDANPLSLSEDWARLDGDD